MALKKIEQSDLANKGVIGLPDTPALSTSDMQKKFEETARDVVIPHFNKLVDTLESPTGASNIGVPTPQGYEANPNVQAVLDAIAKTSNENKADRHSHSNKSVLDTITDLIKKGYDRLVTLFEGIKNVSNTVTNSTEEIPTSKAIVDYVKELGGGDMLRSEYDTNKNGVVDDSEKLGGKFPGEYAKTADFEKYKESVSVEFSKINSNIGNLLVTVKAKTPSTASSLERVASYPPGFDKTNTILVGYNFAGSNGSERMLNYTSVDIISGRDDGIYMRVTNANVVNRDLYLLLAKIQA